MITNGYGLHTSLRRPRAIEKLAGQLSDWNRHRSKRKRYKVMVMSGNFRKRLNRGSNSESDRIAKVDVSRKQQHHV